MGEEWGHRGEKEQEKGQGDWEKWSRDPLSSAVWALILIMIGVLLLLVSLELVPFIRWGNVWSYILVGVGAIFLLEIVVRLLMPVYRRPLGGRLIIAAVLLVIGLGGILNVTLWPLILIAVGVGLLLGAILRPKF